MKKLTLLIVCVACSAFAFGQKTSDTTDNNNPLNHKGHPGGKVPIYVYEKIKDISSNPLNHRGRPGTRLPIIPPGRRIDTVQLPFRDDFSYKHTYPDTILWFDNYAYINSTYPTNPLSYGVATLSGLNQNGIAFAIADSALLGISFAGADSLTSMAIDLSNPANDSGLYFSFAFEPEGLGDYPSITGQEPGDSLILEFSENDTTWDEIWSHDGYDSSFTNPTFTNVIIPVDSLPNSAAYLRKDFQFRFRNYANILGNNNHWHLDYVYLNNKRNSSDTIFRNDQAFLAAPGGFLKNYTAMPWSHFYNYQQQEIGDSAHFCVVNYFNTALSPTIYLDLTEMVSNTAIPTIPFSGGFTLNSLDSQCFTRPVVDSINFIPADSDSVMMRVRTYVDYTPNDFYPDNDTVYTDVPFFNYFAYDDGSAEKAYGLEGEESSFLQFAYQFHLNHTDTLRAIQIHFTTIDYNTDQDLFSIFVWKKINLENNSGELDSVIYEEDYRMPLYVDSINAFATFTIKKQFIDTAVLKADSIAGIDSALVISDTFYVGWQQISGLNIEVGYDRNDDARQHMFYSANDVWQSSALDSLLPPGAPMIRPIVGKNVPLIDTYIQNVAQPAVSSLRVYPNPVKTNLYANYKVEKDGTYAEVYDLLGRLVLKQPYYTNNPIDVSSLQPGLYLLRFTSSGSVSQVARFVKM